MALIGPAGYRPERTMGDAFTARSKPVPYKYGWQATMAGLRNIVGAMATPKPQPPQAPVPVYYDYPVEGSPDAATYPRSYGTRSTTGIAEGSVSGDPAYIMGRVKSGRRKTMGDQQVADIVVEMMKQPEFSDRVADSIVASAYNDPFNVPPAPESQFVMEEPYSDSGISGPSMSAAGKMSSAGPIRQQPFVVNPSAEMPSSAIAGPSLSVYGKRSSAGPIMPPPSSAGPSAGMPSSAIAGPGISVYGKKSSARNYAERPYGPVAKEERMLRAGTPGTSRQVIERMKPPAKKMDDMDAKQILEELSRQPGFGEWLKRMSTRR